MDVTTAERAQEKGFAITHNLQDIRYTLPMEANAASGSREQISIKRGRGEEDESLACWRLWC
jgi:hypothetical protein